jgi:hypothetical protein
MAVQDLELLDRLDMLVEELLDVLGEAVHAADNVTRAGVRE